MNRLHGSGDAGVCRCCALLGYTKQAYYKHLQLEQKRALEEALILQEVASIRKELPVLGGRKLYHLVRERLPQEPLPGRDAFFKLLGANGLLIRKRRNVRPITTMSWHHFHKFSNLWKGRIPDSPNEVWVADITYIRLCNGCFLYLSLLTDVYSHKIVGWQLSDRLDVEGPLNALKMALESLPAGHRLIHHSDRGVQYCSRAYVELLEANGIQISMTENGDPRENAVAERVNGILKEEWTNRMEITSLQQGQCILKTVIEAYNGKRPHLSNGYLTPEQAHASTGTLKRQWKTYYKKKKNMYNIEEENVSL